MKRVLRTPAVLAWATMTSTAWAAEIPRSATGTTARSPAGARPAVQSRGLLPDPVLLDGSTHAAEKKSEFGMIGDFELPGDETSRNGRGGGGSGKPPPEQQNAGGAVPQGGGGRGAPAAQTAQAGGGKEESPAADGSGSAGPESKPGNQPGDPNAKAEGIRVAELGGDPSGAMGEQGGPKPAPVAIGDKAMRIPQQTPNVAVVGAQQLPNQNTQVYEKATGTGGKGPTSSQGPSRTEKGRAIPAGL